MNRATVRTPFIALALFGVAMGFLEAIVVVYLRQLYYPEGFSFPLKLLSPSMMFVEWVREAATIVMLVAVGIIAGKNNLQRFCYFLYAFGVWDIVYYVALKLFLGWPPSLLTWDILFLIPLPWVGPVLAPLICSLTMILFCASIVRRQERDSQVRLALFHWGLVIGGAGIVFLAFVRDFSVIILGNGFLSRQSLLSTDSRFWETITGYVPVSFAWPLFGIGELLILAGLFLSLAGKPSAD